MMIELMERVPITGQLADDATALKRKLLKASDTTELKPCVAALVQLIQNLRGELQGEIDGLAEFLRTTAQRLQDCEQVMTRSRELHVAASNDAVQLSDTVCMDLCVLRGDVSESEDLEAVKSMIESKLNSIGDGLNDFINAQKERTTEADGAIELMVDRLKHLEEETKNLREESRRTACARIDRSFDRDPQPVRLSGNRGQTVRPLETLRRSDEPRGHRSRSVQGN